MKTWRVFGRMYSSQSQTCIFEMDCSSNKIYFFYAIIFQLFILLVWVKGVSWNHFSYEVRLLTLLKGIAMGYAN